MKKVILLLSLILCSFAYTPLSYANEGGIKVQVTEPVPGANCKPSTKTSGGTTDSGSTLPATQMYECTIQPGFGSIVSMFGEMIKYFTYIAALGAVLFIVINGIMYSMAGINDSLKTGAKDRITKTLIGLIILMLSGVILNAIAPWIYK